MPEGGSSHCARVLKEPRACRLKSATPVGAWTKTRAGARTVLHHQGERGTGLGLAMVYGARHSGDIAVESEVGQGTTVRLHRCRARRHTVPCEVPTVFESCLVTIRVPASLRTRWKRTRQIVTGNGGRDGIETFQRHTKASRLLGRHRPRHALRRRRQVANA
jgi:hypothetical protein